MIEAGPLKQKVYLARENPPIFSRGRSQDDYDDDGSFDSGGSFGGGSFGGGGSSGGWDDGGWDDDD